VPGSPADEADVKASLSLSDVRLAGTLADYGGDLEALLDVRLTDGASGPAQSEAATVSDMSSPITVPCTPTAMAVGSMCEVATTFDAVVPGSVPEGDRAIWALDQLEVLDGNGAVFARQGVFVP